MPDSLIPLDDLARPPATLLAHLPGMAYRRRNDRLFTMEYVSPGAHALTGYRPVDLARNSIISFIEIVHPDDRERIHDDVKIAIASDRVIHLTYRIGTATGDVKWVWDKGRVVHSPAGSIAAIEGFIEDVTAHVMFERRLKAHNAALERRAIEAQEMEAVARLAGGFAHDFSNLVTMIGGNADLALQSLPADHPTRDIVVEIKQTADRAAALTRQLQAACVAPPISSPATTS